MANRESNLDLISVNQSQKEVTANELFNAASPAMLYGRRASLSTGLTFGYYGGNIVTSSGSVVAVENGTVELTAESTNYIVARKSDGEVSASTSDTDWNSSDYWRLYLCETGALTVTDYTDYRIIGEMTSVAGGGGDILPGGAAGEVLVKNSSSDGDVKWSSAIGENALANLTTGTNNVAIGLNALRDTDTGYSNVAIGVNVMPVNTAGHNCVAIGQSCLKENLTGLYNVAVGNLCLEDNTTGNNNVAIGRQTLRDNTTGSNNISLGLSGLGSNIDGDYNIGIGNSSLSLNTSGDFNIGIGREALSTNTTGSGNIEIRSTGGGSALFSPTTESNRVMLGSTNTTNAYIQVAWTVVSDGRDKTNIEPVPHGLEFIEKLNPVSFQFRKSRDSDEAHGNKRYGFIAQDILELEGDNPVIIDNEDEDKLKYNGESLVPVLVKAIQEQMVIIRQLQEDIRFLKGI